MLETMIKKGRFENFNQFPLPKRFHVYQEIKEEEGDESQT